MINAKKSSLFKMYCLIRYLTIQCFLKILISYSPRYGLLISATWFYDLSSSATSHPNQKTRFPLSTYSHEQSIFVVGSMEPATHLSWRAI